MQFATFLPTRLLSEFIDSYWVVTHPDNRERFTEWVYPQATIQMLFYFGVPFRERKSDGTCLIMPGSCLCGIQDSYSELTTVSGFGVFGVVFKTPAACQILHLPLHEIRNTSLPLNNWLGLTGDELSERINLARDHRERINILEAFFLGRMKEPAYDQQRIGSVLQEMNRIHHQPSLSLLAGKACLSERQFERVFATYTGTTPKLYSRIQRINSAIKRAEGNRSLPLTQIALDAGYYDQSHFNNEFREMTGFSPKEFFRMNCQPEDQSPTR